MQNESAESGANAVDQDALLVKIERLAEAYARESLQRADAKDIAHDVVLYCLSRMRSGKLVLEGATLAAFARTLATARTTNFVVRDKRRGRRDLRCVDAVHVPGHTWMAPDDMIDDRTLGEFLESRLGDLPPRCRTVFVMIRRDEITYDDAAARLGVSASAISRHMVKANSRFREWLAEIDIVPPQPTRGGACKKSKARCRSGLCQDGGTVATEPATVS